MDCAASLDPLGEIGINVVMRMYYFLLITYVPLYKQSSTHLYHSVSFLSPISWGPIIEVLQPHHTK